MSFATLHYSRRLLRFRHGFAQHKMLRHGSPRLHIARHCGTARFHRFYRRHRHICNRERRLYLRLYPRRAYLRNAYQKGVPESACNVNWTICLLFFRQCVVLHTERRIVFRGAFGMRTSLSAVRHYKNHACRNYGEKV